MEKCAIGWSVGLELSWLREKEIGLEFPGERAKKKAGFFFRILVLKTPEFQFYSLQVRYD
jgi:hypothetical protein